MKPAELNGSTTSVHGKISILADKGDSDVLLATQLKDSLTAASLFIDEADSARGLMKDEFVSLLSSPAHQESNRFIVLWGSGTPANTVEATASLNEKLIGFFQAVAETRTTPVEVTLVTRGAKSPLRHSTITNLAAHSLSAAALTAQNEYELITCRSIDLDSERLKNEVSCILAEVDAGSQGDVAFRNEQRFENALLPLAEEDESEKVIDVSVEEPVELRLGTRGKLESLRFELADLAEPGEGEIGIRVHIVSLNYKDLLKIDGRIHPAALEDTFNGTEFGMECAGIVERCG